MPTRSFSCCWLPLLRRRARADGGVLKDEAAESGPAVGPTVNVRGLRGGLLLVLPPSILLGSGLGESTAAEGTGANGASSATDSGCICRMPGNASCSRAARSVEDAAGGCIRGGRSSDESAWTASIALAGGAFILTEPTAAAAAPEMLSGSAATNIEAAGL